MFRKFAALQWLWFWVASVAMYFAQAWVVSTLFFEREKDTEILGAFFWAGSAVVFWTWVVQGVIKSFKKWLDKR